MHALHHKIMPNFRRAMMPTTLIFETFNPANDSLPISFRVNSAGNFASSGTDMSAIDENKLKDLYIYLEYKVKGNDS